MEKEQRNRLQKATQDARRLLEEEFAGQLLQTYDINVAAGRWNEEPGAHLQAEQQLIREKLVAWIEHKEAQINDRKEALLLALREMAFTALNRFVALKLMEARELVRPCVSGGLESEGFQEFTAVAQGLLVDQESSYRLYLETIFEDVSRELRALFDPRDPASLLWPKRTALLELLDILNRPELAELWKEDETLGWVYQYFNGDAERKKMREESSAPRNSRELAVRNQFFTPRYVVEFLTDNTLGRIWYEMRQGDTGLKERCRYLVRRPNEIWLQSGEEAPAEVVADEALSQEELLRQVVHIPYRLLKDPREIRMLDPACGSMHFGLYAFDLYLAIYGEAWEIAQGSDKQAKQGEAFAAFVAYAAGFADKAAFLREVPRLILQHNIHGVDIDPRATQIARLTLWLRAQRAWQEQQIEVAARPAISRSNVVCAEPMPGERELLADFVDQQFPEAERGLFQQLLETIFDKMQLAGEAGSLLKIEEEVRDAIEQARREWQKLAIQQRDLFSTAELAALGGVGSALNTDLQNLTKDFWLNIEERIYVALRDYAEQAEIGSGLQRRLFAEDAAQGFAFIDVCRKSYDVAVMNPPFGEASIGSRTYLYESLPEASRDLFAGFVTRFNKLLLPEGLLGVLSNRTAFFSDFLARWRIENFLGEVASLSAFADLGYGVLDAVVEAAAYVCSRKCTVSGLFINVLGAENKADALKQQLLAIHSGLAASDSVTRDLRVFERLPDHRFIYQLHSFWADKLNLEGENRIFTSRSGLTTGDDPRHLRLYFETASGQIGKRWKWLAKGGEFSRYRTDLHLLVDWQSRDSFARMRNHELYGKSGVTYTERTTSNLSARVLNEGSYFSVPGPGIIPNDPAHLHFLLAFINSFAAVYVVEALIGGGDFSMKGTAARHLEPGYMKHLPILAISSDDANWFKGRVNELLEWLEAFVADEADALFIKLPIRSGKSLHSAIEESSREAFRAFKYAYRVIAVLENRISELLEIPQDRIRDTYSDTGWPWATHETLPEGEHSIILNADPLSPRAGIPENEFGPTKHRFEMKLSHYLHSGVERYAAFRRVSPVAVCELLERRATSSPASILAYAEAAIAYVCGVAFGRWDVRYATGEQAAPELPRPFAPLPTCPPGQLKNMQGLPAGPKDVPAAYLVRIPWDGILVDDPNHPRDLECRIREVIAIIWSGQEDGPTAHAIEHEACEILGVRSLRDYFRKPAGFFANHLSRYSKSRRQAPIYWPISAGSGSYSVWLYYHRFTQDTLYRVLGDFVEIRIQEAEREKFELESQGGLSGDAASLLQEAQTLLQDLRLFKSELELVAPLWNPNLNDGVIINHAILWRITPYTPWQKKCKECWDKLVNGDYDWAHLAFHLWPERVIRKCTTDRSLAIAHGLEERLWQETNNGNWLQRQVPEAELQALLAEYSKPAVQNALERFLAAPPPVAAARTRAPRAAKSSSPGTTRRPRGAATAVDAEASRQTLLVLTAAPADGLGRNAIADLLDVDAASLTAVIKQLKEGGQIEQLGAARGAKYRLSEQGRASLEPEQDA